jgi:AcrR family transcriptional regulator
MSGPLQGKTSPTTERGLERSREILEAAHEIFVRDGYGRFSMRSVAAQVGASLSNVQHYYPTKSILFEAMLLYSIGRYQTAIDEIVRGMPGATRLDQFMAAMDMFLADVKKPPVAGSLIQIWAAALVDPLAAAIASKIQKRERKTIFHLIRGITPEFSESECQARAALIVAQIEGLILQHAGSRAAPTLANESLDAIARQSFQWLATRV